MIAVVAVSAGALALAGLFFYLSLSLPDSAALLPMGLSGCVAVLAVVMAVQGWLQRRSQAVFSWPSHPGRVVGFVAGILAYAALLQPLGYFVVTPLFIAGMLLFLRATSVPMALAVATAASAVVWGMFVWFLGLPMPLGLLS